MNFTQSPATPPISSRRKRELLDRIETSLDETERWREFNAAYHDDDRKFMRFLVPPGKRVLELGCGNGHMLAALEPSFGVGVDFSRAMVERAEHRHVTHVVFVTGRSGGRAARATCGG